MSNSNIAASIDSEFIRDKDPKKFVILWTTKFHKKLNKVMRNVDFETIKKDYPYTSFFMTNLIDYFYKYGKYKRDLIGKTDFLYRGLDKEFSFKEGNIYEENCFMSTSYDSSIAEGFAESKGNILVFDVNKLPYDIPFIIINRQLREHLNEREILFLPYSYILPKEINNRQAIRYFKAKLKKHSDITFFSAEYFSRLKYNYKIYSKEQMKGGSTEEQNIGYYDYS
jgi:hypothetical protein